uniref:Uncharacterized protein n=1 Tax=Panagrolaimus sp. PS1159 TaxID=55785 RepID=A0AC35EXP6_9BILA
MYKKMLFQLLISLICLTFTQAYFPKQLIPKRLRVKMCEKNPTLSICDSLIIPLKSYESSRESNGFVEPTISTENITKVTKMFNSIKVCF